MSDQTDDGFKSFSCADELVDVLAELAEADTGCVVSYYGDGVAVLRMPDGTTFRVTVEQLP